MKAPAGIATVGAVVLLAGCIPSLHPFYTDKDLVFDPDLAGCWSQGEGKNTWEFSKTDEKEYELILTDKNGKSGSFVVRLFELDGERFIDMFPKKQNSEQPSLYEFHLQPLHGLMYVKQVKPTLQLQMPSPKWLHGYLEEHPDAIAHEVPQDRAILTASTEELQKFWRKHLETEGAFGDPLSMTKTEEDAASQPEEATSGE